MLKFVQLAKWYISLLSRRYSVGYIKSNLCFLSSADNVSIIFILSITFGIFGSEFYSLYNPNCGNAITAYGRVACRVAKECLEDKTLGIC